MRLSLRQVRKNIAQKAFGKVVAVSLAVSLTIPPQLGYALSTEYTRGGG